MSPTMELLEERLLVVDDDKKFLESAESVFREFGFDVETAANEHEALEAVRDSDFSAALLDLGLPERDGVELAKELRSIQPNIGIFFLSGRVDMPFFQRKAEEGDLEALAWYTKPIPPSEKKAAQMVEGMKSKIVHGRFRGLVRKWKRDTSFSSSVTKIVIHPAYQRIIGMGPAILPSILSELKKDPDHWFWALKSITGADPVTEPDRGNVRAMAKAWLHWARERGIEDEERE
jgi:CheY-like chemotaxis protein